MLKPQPSTPDIYDAPPDDDPEFEYENDLKDDAPDFPPTSFEEDWPEYP